MYSAEEIEKENQVARYERRHLVAAWDAEFRQYAPDGARFAPESGAVMPVAGERVVDVWVELPRYGGIVIAAETSEGRILSPFYDQSPDEELEDGEVGDVALCEDQPDEYLDMMLGATEFTSWTEYPTTGIRYWG